MVLVNYVPYMVMPIKYLNLNLNILAAPDCFSNNNKAPTCKRCPHVSYCFVCAICLDEIQCGPGTDDGILQ